MENVMQKLLRGLAIVIALAAHPALAKDGYIAPSQLDLIHTLPPPPVANSPALKTDLEAVLDAQRTRTDAQVKSAQDDLKRSVFRFADVLGADFRQDNLPFAAKFFKRVAKNVKDVLAPAKIYFNRQRPFVVDPNVKPAVKEPSDLSYPSGHATFAFADAALLAAMIPEKADAIFERAARYARNRVIAGAHFPTDIEAGRIAGGAIAAKLMQDRAFMGDFNRAKAETRHALRLS
jgi:acid phosphatase (class A)